RITTLALVVQSTCGVSVCIDTEGSHVPCNRLAQDQATYIFNVIGPLISCLIFGVHSSLEPSPVRRLRGTFPHRVHSYRKTSRLSPTRFARGARRVSPGSLTPSSSQIRA